MPESDGRQHGSELPIVIGVCTGIIFIFMLLCQGVVGLIYINDCPTQPFLPIYLIVMAGVIPMLKVKDLNRACLCLVSVFYFMWFIAGNMCIYSIYEPNYSNTQPSSYCNKTLYLFALWTTILTYVLLGVIFCLWYCEQQDPGDAADTPTEG